MLNNTSADMDNHLAIIASTPSGKAFLAWVRDSAEETLRSCALCEVDRPAERLGARQLLLLLAEFERAASARQ